MKQKNTLAETLTKLRDEAYKDACEKGFHDKEYSDKHWLMLIVCEVAEVIEADRIGKHANLKSFYKDWNECGVIGLAFNADIKGTVEDELADVCIRVLDFMGLQGFPVDIETNLPENCEEYYLDEDDVNGSDLVNFCFQLSDVLVCSAFHVALGEDMELVLEKVLAWCMGHGIDILKHIRLKMDYNKTRERLHGKRY